MAPILGDHRHEEVEQVPKMDEVEVSGLWLPWTGRPPPRDLDIGLMAPLQGDHRHEEEEVWTLVGLEPRAVVVPHRRLRLEVTGVVSP
mmetsp:Transcript_88357/g.285402  ORF Transcript_88357/g.285402 Transcript_88357/m.285402 type:complete len:88 (-) Transcript_88357:50-313(-)